MHSKSRIVNSEYYLVVCADVCGLIHQICRIKVKAGKVVEQCSSLVSRKGEYSKSFSETKVFKIQVCKVL